MDSPCSKEWSIEIEMKMRDKKTTIQHPTFLRIIFKRNDPTWRVLRKNVFVGNVHSHSWHLERTEEIYTKISMVLPMSCNEARRRNCSWERNCEDVKNKWDEFYFVNDFDNASSTFGYEVVHTYILNSRLAVEKLKNCFKTKSRKFSGVISQQVFVKQLFDVVSLSL